MKVRELIEFLTKQDPNAEVLIVSQKQWPLENAVVGVVDRKTVVEDYQEDDEGRHVPPRYKDGEAPSDVLIVEGEWLRYGNRAAWEAVRWEAEAPRR